MSGVLFVLLLFEMIFGKRGDTIAVRAAIAGAAIFTVYLTADFVSDVIADIELARTIYFVVLAVAIGLSVRFSKKLRFRTTPTDYLVVFGLITVAAFTNETFDARAASLLVIEAVILMYGCEILIGRQGGRWSVLNTVTLFALGVLAARGLLLPV
jgi:UDP-GlcNAc:undecaprenyl-phosphate GlcNAc-1-phosphate transferase